MFSVNSHYFPNSTTRKIFADMFLARAHHKPCCKNNMNMPVSEDGLGVAAEPDAPSFQVLPLFTGPDAKEK